MDILIDSGSLLFLATLVLVFVTAYYALQIRRTVEEMRKAAEAQFLPHLKMAFNDLPNSAKIYV